jgi:hypothetical protein
MLSLMMVWNVLLNLLCEKTSAVLSNPKFWLKADVLKKLRNLDTPIKPMSLLMVVLSCFKELGWASYMLLEIQMLKQYLTYRLIINNRPQNCQENIVS